MLFYILLLLAFIISSFTGIVFRFQVASGIAFWSSVFLKHAHSHLMMFGWMTPALLFFLYRSCKPEQSYKDRKIGKFVFVLPVLTGFFAFISFLFSGYGRMNILGYSVPASIILSITNMILWYPPVFLILRRIGVRREFSGHLIALVSLLLSTVILWLFPLFLNFAQSEVDRVRPVHLFLVIFSDAWPVFAVIALLFVKKGESLSIWSSGGMVVALLATLVNGWFAADFLHCSTALVSMENFIRLFYVIYGAGIALPLIEYIYKSEKSYLEYSVISFYALKVLMAFSVIFLPVCLAASYRILYIHAGLLLFVTTFIFYEMGDLIGYRKVFYAGAVNLIMFAGIIPYYITLPFIPVSLSAQIAFVTSLFPLVVAVWIGVHIMGKTIRQSHYVDSHEYGV